MKIKITKRLPIANPPEVGSIHEVIRRERQSRQGIKGQGYIS